MESIGTILAWVGMGLMLGIPCAASGMGFGITCPAVIGVLKKKPEVFGSVLILSALPSTNGLYGFVGFIMYNTALTETITVFQGAIVFGAGIMMAIGCFVTGVYQAKIAADGIVATGGGHNVFGNTMILAAFPEFYAILTLVGAVLLLPLLSGGASAG
jgi:V/A-type H+-transporting ATPase subunit K